MKARLPVAYGRVVLLFVAVLLCCWLVDFAVWPLFACVFLAATIVSIISGDDSGIFTIGAAVYLIREWAFGFPHLILRPQVEQSVKESAGIELDALIGRVGIITSPLRPIGEVEIDGVRHVAASLDGTFVDLNDSVQVKSVRHGKLYVAVFDASRA